MSVLPLRPPQGLPIDYKTYGIIRNSFLVGHKMLGSLNGNPTVEVTKCVGSKVYAIVTARDPLVRDVYHTYKREFFRHKLQDVFNDYFPDGRVPYYGGYSVEMWNSAFEQYNIVFSETEIASAVIDTVKNEVTITADRNSGRWYGVGKIGLPVAPLVE